MNANVPIVVAAHNRPDALARLLASIARASIAPETLLTISIDGGAPREGAVANVAERFMWPHGPKRVERRDHLGLVKHFFVCGDLSREHGAVIYLEDDLVVGPSFQQWARDALSASAADDRIAGVSLATPFFDGYRHLPFEPVIDGSDAIFMQVPWYDGMAWSDVQWSAFRNHEPSQVHLHRSLDSLDEDEWFPAAMGYLVETERYYVMPRHAQATNSGAAGVHFDQATNYFQVPLAIAGPESWRFHTLDNALAIYDDHMELQPSAIKRMVPRFADYDFAVDLRGTRELRHVRSPHVLTTRQTLRSEESWAASMHPLIANIIHGVGGNDISLSLRADVVDSPASDQRAAAVLQNYATRGRTVATREQLDVLLRSAKSAAQRRARRLLPGANQ